MQMLRATRVLWTPLLLPVHNGECPPKGEYGHLKPRVYVIKVAIRVQASARWLMNHCTSLQLLGHDIGRPY
jgi:hypothetical protein